MVALNYDDDVCDSIASPASTGTFHVDSSMICFYSDENIVNWYRVRNLSVVLERSKACTRPLTLRCAFSNIVSLVYVRRDG